MYRPRSKWSGGFSLMMGVLLAVVLATVFVQRMQCDTPTQSMDSARSSIEAPPERKCEPCPTCNAPNCKPCENPKARRGDIPEVAGQKFKFVKQDRPAITTMLAEREKWEPAQWEKEALRLMDKNRMHKYTIVATANLGHLNFTLNWIASLELHNYKKFLIYCFDFQLYSILVQYGYENNAVVAPLTWSTFVIPAQEHKWMESNYNKLTQAKLNIQSALLERGYWILFSDVDLVFLSPSVLEHLRYLIGVNCNEDSPKDCFGDFLYMYDQDTDVNTGFFLARATPEIKEVFKNTIATMGKWGVDQLAFNYQIRTTMKVKYSKTFRGLDKLLYANGYTFNSNHLNQKFGIKPMIVHANYVEGYTKKKDLLAAGGFWFIDA